MDTKQEFQILLIFPQTKLILLLCLFIAVLKTNVNCQQISNANLKPPPPFWQEHWFEHIENVSRVYLDNHVAGYLDDDVVSTVRWPFEFLSKVWRYVKNNYGNFGPDQHLYVILHSQKYSGGHPSYWYRNTHDFRNVVDFGQQNKDAWTEVNHAGDMASLLTVVGFVVEYSNKQTQGSPGDDVWGENGPSQWNDIFVYDILLKMGFEKEAAAFLKRRLEQRVKFPKEWTFWIRDWFEPIYKKYGGIRALNGFFESIYFNFPRGRRNGSAMQHFEYKERMNMGEFVHFWSGTVGENLRYLAVDAFNWTQEYQNEFETARIRYPELKYPCDDCNKFPTFRTSQPPQEVKKDQTVVIAVSVSVLVGIIIFLAGVLLVARKKINLLRQTIRDLTEEEIKEFYDGNFDGKEAFLKGGGGKGAGNNLSICAMPFDKSYELSLDKLVIAQDQIIGCGQFGLVLRGSIKGCEGSENASHPCAVKTMKPDVEVDYFKALLMELKVMAYLGAHDNITTLLGAMTSSIKNRELYVALELCAHGDLQKYLIDNRKHFKSLLKESTQEAYSNAIVNPEVKIEMDLDPKIKYNSSDPDTGYLNYPQQISTLDLIQWSKDIANGMTYLTEKKVIHGDLAARNILLTITNVAKISDFGLSRQLVNYSTYLKKPTTPLPWRWMSIESLKDMKFSIESDIWAFGVTMWEIFALGELPYPGWTWDYDFVDKLTSGSRLNAPSHANLAIYEMMLDCWKLNPLERPTFCQLLEKLSGILTNMKCSQMQGEEKDDQNDSSHNKSTSL